MRLVPIFPWLLLLGACSHTPSPADFIDQPSGHFLYKHLPGDEITAVAAAANDATWERAVPE